MKSILISSFIIALFLTACSNDGEWKDGQIPSDVHSEISVQKEKILAAMRAGDRAGLEALSFPGLVSKAPELFIAVADKTVPEMIKDHPFTVTNEFYLHKQITHKNTSLFSGTGPEDFRITFKPRTVESYVIVGEFDTPSGMLSLLLILGKSANEWKISVIYLGQRTVNGKTIFEWVKIVKKNIGDKDFTDAGLACKNIDIMLKPAGNFWHYNAENKIKQDCAEPKRIYDVMLFFPVTCDQVESKPVIHSLDLIRKEDGVYPSFDYTTQLSINDIEALKAECALIHASIGKQFRGIDRNNRKIIYRAWEKSALNHEKDVHYESHEFIMDTKAP